MPARSKTGRTSIGRGRTTKAGNGRRTKAAGGRRKAGARTGGRTLKAKGMKRVAAKRVGAGRLVDFNDPNVREWIQDTIGDNVSRTIKSEFKALRRELQEERQSSLSAPGAHA